MYLIFLDGTGNTGAQLDHPTSTIHYILGLAIHSDRARALEDDVTAVLSATFGADECRRPRFECKGSDMYRGEGPCAAMRPADRIALYERLVSLVPHHGVRVIYRGIDKPALRRKYATPMHPHELAFLFFAEEAQRFLAKQRAYGLLISDEEKSVEQQVIENIPRYKELGTRFGHSPVSLTRVVDNVHWVRSHDSRLLQLTDVCAFLCQRWYRDRDKNTPQALGIQRLWGVLQPCVHSGKIWP